MRVSLAEIKIRPGGKRVQLDHSLEVESLYIGRGPDNDLSLKGLTISLHHATIRIGEGQSYIEAAAGLEVQVNGLPTRGERLSIGDEVHIGPWTLRVLAPEGEYDLCIEYEERGQRDDARTALDRRTQLGIERGLFGRRPITWIGLGIIFVGFLGIPLIWPAARSVWTTGPVIRGHAIIENDCGQCHSGLFRRVENSSCTDCHADVRRHAPIDLEMQTLNDMRCAECHFEHRGREVALADQGAGYCVTCHSNLSEQFPDTTFQDVSDFGSHHPPIQLAMVSDPAEEAERKEWSSDLEENSGVEFSHYMHVSQTLDGPDDEERLSCGQCHQAAEDGRGMQPVSFDRQCRRCHELDVGEPDLVGNLIHGDAERIRNQLRDYYTEQVLNAQIQDQEAPRALRIRRAGPLENGEERGLSTQWVGQKVAATDAILFSGDGCALCHALGGGEVSKQTGRWIPRTVMPVQIAETWIENSRFSHAAHATQACATCHPAAAVRDPDEDPEEEPGWAKLGALPYGLIEETEGIAVSEASSDVLIPSLETCRGCHVSPDKSGHGKVSSPCSACHDFHDHSLEPMAQVSVDSDG